MAGLELLHGYTDDGLRLGAVHWQPEGEKKLCVVYTHGMNDHPLENPFMESIAGVLTPSGVGVLFGLNRGNAFINTLYTQKETPDGGYVTKQYGTMYDVFEECIYDVDLWVKKAFELGYQEIVLFGHSLGCNKTLYYLFQQPDARIQDKLKGIILASPVDMVGTTQTQPSSNNYLFSRLWGRQMQYKQMMREADVYMAAGQETELLSFRLWGIYLVSARTAKSLLTPGGAADNIPLVKNPNVFPALANINVPIMTLISEFDSTIIKSAQQDLALLEQKATSCPVFTKVCVHGANHRYMRHHKDIAKAIQQFVCSL